MSATAPDMATDRPVPGARPKVLVRENIGDSGVSLLREHFDVDLGFDWTEEDLARAHRRLRRHRDPLGHEDDRGADRPRGAGCG